MSTRTSFAYWQLGRRYAIHVYVEMLNDRVYLDIGPHGYNRFCLPIAPAPVGRMLKRWKYRP